MDIGKTRNEVHIEFLLRAIWEIFEVEFSTNNVLIFSKERMNPNPQF